MNCAIPCPYDFAGTPCQLELFHTGNHSWPTVIDMDGWLPLCRQCGGKAARCPCPLVGADGLSNVIPPPDPPLSPGMARIRELNSQLHWPAPVAATDARRKRADAHRWAPAKPGDRDPLPPVPNGPWCPAHGWDRNKTCTGCDAVWDQRT